FAGALLALTGGYVKVRHVPPKPAVSVPQSPQTVAGATCPNHAPCQAYPMTRRKPAAALANQVARFARRGAPAQMQP
ncbi:hypothetical protein, partial [Burkholderia cepacia]